MLQMLQILLFIISTEIKKIRVCRALSNTSGNLVTKPKEKNKKDQVGGVVLQTPQLIDCRIMKLQLATFQNVGNLQNMKSIFQFQCFMLFQMRTVYTTIHIFPLVRQLVQKQCWQSQLINTQTYKPGPGLPKDIIYKIRPIYIFRVKRH